MGAARSKNVAEVMISAISSVATDISTRSEITANSTQVISVRDVNDVIISDIVQRIEVQVNIAAMMDAFSDTLAQQELIQAVTQSSKSLVSGINLFQYASAHNEVRQSMSATLNVSTNIRLYCESLTSTSQSIIVEQARGRVQITGVTQESMVGVLSQCTQQAVAQTTSVQSLQQSLDQSAEATAEGIDPMALVMMLLLVLAIIIIVPVAGATAGGAMLGSIISAIMLAIGIILLLFYEQSVEEVMLITDYSRLISNTTSCGAVLESERDDFSSPGIGAAICIDDESCVAMDWESVKVLRSGEVEFLERPITRFYSRMTNLPCIEVQELQNAQKLVFEPQFWLYRPSLGESIPDVNSEGLFPSDVAIDVDRLEVYVLTEGNSGAYWAEQREQLTEDPVQDPPFAHDLTVNEDTPTASDGNPQDLWLVISNPAEWRLLVKTSSNTWGEERAEIPGTGYSVRTGCEQLVDNIVRGAPDSEDDPPQNEINWDQVAEFCTNVSGFKVETSNSAMQIFGIGFTIVGSIMMLLGALKAVKNTKRDKAGFKPSNSSLKAAREADRKYYEAMIKKQVAATATAKTAAPPT